jgi:hypothetical protein
MAGFNQGPEIMKFTVIAARLHKIAVDIEALAAENGDHEFPDEMVPRLWLLRMSHSSCGTNTINTLCS